MMGKRKPKMVAHYEVTVWNQSNGDIMRYVSDATEAELDELRNYYDDEPWAAVVIDREWEEADEE